jgi:hypothetical protein
MNLDANKAFKSTGQLPAVSQMPETRTTSEILADQQKIRMSLMEDLKPLGSPAFTSDVIQAVQRSPLNIDGSLFIFFAQRAPEITANVKKQYKFGIKGDKNDVAQFVFFVEDMYNKTKSFAGSVKTYFNRPAETGLGKGTIKFGDIESIKNIYEEVARKLLLLKTEFPSTREYNNHREALKNISTMFNELSTTLRNADYVSNTRTFLDSNTKLIADPRYNDIIDNYSDLYKRYNEILDNFPKATTLYTLIGKLDDSTKNKNYELMSEIIGLIVEQLQPGAEGFTNITRELERARTELNNLLQVEQEQRYTEEREFREIIADNIARTQQQDLVLREIEELEEQEEQDLDRTPPSRPGNLEGLFRPNLDDLETDTRKTDSREASIRTARIEELARVNKELNAILFEARFALNNKNSTQEERVDAQRSIDEIQRTFKRNFDEMTRLKREAQGNGIKMRGRGRPRGSGITPRKTFKDSFHKNKDDTKGIDASPRYIKFGKYFINTHKLQGTGMLSLRRQGGGNISEFPSTRVSKNMSDIVFKMVGGGVPTYQELSKLSEPEKAYLHKISSKANIIDKFSIPAPDKDRQEKDIHDFEVMKGEILAGNDSKELIKKFKLHLVKLSKNGTLPKLEVQEIMEELIQLGF